MRLLLDECIDERLRHHFTGHECQTCRYAGLTGLANVAVLAAADQAGFEVLITGDQNMLKALEILRSGEVVRVGIR